VTIRHYEANLIDATAGSARYRFTPDSITRKYWGIVEFDLQSFASTIIELAPDPEGWGWPQPYVCECLARKLRRGLESGASGVPENLQFYA